MNDEMKSITEFGRTEQSDGGELVTITVQITVAQNVTADYDFLKGLGFKFNQMEADYLNAEYQTGDYEKGVEVLEKLRAAGHVFC
ncbi:MAG: hypothetical protein JXR87_07090 [Candidatus Marinimicrobia bacterium]|nr:hypothetical protein [Candidatus Neomarinimicrobiota bacterium]